jgi:uncharacterized BrkB/YihY/UPF0761 family membrane protein
MFSSGQLWFALAFFIAFVVAMFYAYGKDKNLHQKYYKGSYWVLIAFLLFIVFLFIIKFTTKH